MASKDHRMNKPKKEGSSGYVYNIPGGGDPYPQEAVKRVIPRGWGSFMRSKAHRESNEKEGAKKNVVVQKEVVASSRKSTKIEVKSRSSVSSIMEVKNQSSVSQVDNVGSLMRSKTYRENSVQLEEVKGNIEIQKEVITSSRKSVSSIMEVKSRSSVSSIKDMNSRSSVSQVENVKSVAALLNVKVLVSDMPGFMQLHAFRCTRTTYNSLDKFSSKHMAYNVKKEFDKVYGPTWHCIVGSSFGSFVTHATGCFLYFSMEKLYILLFKTKVQKALSS